MASEPVQTELWDNPTTPIPHTKFGQGADLILVAPATARLLAAYRMGLSTDLLTNTLIATRAPGDGVPGDAHRDVGAPERRRQRRRAASRGVHIVEPESGRLAGGDVGAGRLADPAVIVAAVERVLGPRDLDGVSVVVSAGGTREPIDSVRVIANRSSGKQGYAVAAEAAARGAA
jgi:phosphopantothenoylcysteine decarboxylase/phosphopantothenate--cysteine ligase